LYNTTTTKAPDCTTAAITRHRSLHKYEQQQHRLENTGDKISRPEYSCRSQQHYQRGKDTRSHWPIFWTESDADANRTTVDFIKTPALSGKDTACFEGFL